MKLGCSSVTYQMGGISIADSLDHLHEFGFRYVDLPGYGIFQPQYYSSSDRRRIVKRLEQLDMQAHTVIYLPKANPGARDPQERLAAVEELKPAALFHKEMGGRFVMFCEACGRPDYQTDLDREESYANSIDTVKRFCDWAYGQDLGVFLELIPYGGNLYSVERMKDMLEKVDAPNLWANMDLGHCYLQKIHGRRFAQLGEKLINVHISDNDAVGDEGCVMEADKIIGTGNTDFASYFHYLNEMDIDGNAKKAGLEECVAVIECVEGEYIPNPDYAIMRSLDFVLSHVPCLRS